MSEQDKPKRSYMQELDQWVEDNVIDLLFPGWENNDAEYDEAWLEAVAQVKKAFRAKAQESYHNGQRTPAKAQRGGRYGR